MDASDNSECLSRVLKFPTPDRIELLIENAISLKLRYLHKKEIPKKPETVPVQINNSKKQNSNWMANSLNFFSSGPSVKLVNEEKKSGKTILAYEKQQNPTIDKLELCIKMLENEQSKIKNSEIGKCIEMLKEINKELK